MKKVGLKNKYWSGKDWVDLPGTFILALLEMMWVGLRQQWGDPAGDCVGAALLRSSPRARPSRAGRRACGALRDSLAALGLPAPTSEVEAWKKGECARHFP
jgi:hypothetical protein